MVRLCNLSFLPVRVLSLQYHLTTWCLFPPIVHMQTTYISEYISQSESISLSRCQFKGLRQSQVSDEILITPLIGNCEVVVARGAGGLSHHRSPTYSAIDLCLINLIVIIPPPLYFIPLQCVGALRTLTKNRSDHLCLCV